MQLRKSLGDDSGSNNWFHLVGLTKHTALKVAYKDNESLPALSGVRIYYYPGEVGR